MMQRQRSCIYKVNTEILGMQDRSRFLCHTICIAPVCGIDKANWIHDILMTIQIYLPTPMEY